MSSDAGARGGDRGSRAPGDAGAAERGPPDGPSPGASERATATTEDAAADDFGVRGWVLVGVVVLSTVVVPGLLYALPVLPADAGLPFLVAMLVLPLLPAVLLGAAAVWSMSAAADATDDRD